MAAFCGVAIAVFGIAVIRGGQEIASNAWCLVFVVIAAFVLGVLAAWEEP